MFCDLKILIVEDEYPLLRLTTEYLKNLGCTQVIAATDGETALQRLQYEKVDLIIADWNMPCMNGLDLLKALKRNNDFKSIPFMMMTANNKKEGILEAIKEGVDQYIIKPFDGKTLQNKLRFMTS